MYSFGNLSRNILASSKGASRSDARWCASDSKESIAMPDRGLNTLLSIQRLVSCPYLKVITFSIVCSHSMVDMGTSGWFGLDRTWPPPLNKATFRVHKAQFTFHRIPNPRRHKEAPATRGIPGGIYTPWIQWRGGNYAFYASPI
jgi:hypothetical protein